MAQPFISIIVPVYNVGPYIESCIRSVMRQTYEGPMECILVDDCGIDDSVVIVEGLISEYKRPISFQILHHSHNRGMSAARNTGIDAAKGDYIFFLDSDDELTDDCIEVMVKPLEKEWIDLVVGALQVVGSNATYNGLMLKLPDQMLLRGTDILNTYRLKWNMCPVAKLYRTEFINSVHQRFLEGLVYEDELWSFQVAFYASSLYAIQHVVYHYRKNAGGISSRTKGKERAANLSVLVKEIGTFSKKNRIRNQREYQIVNSFFLSALRIFFTEGDRGQYTRSYFQLKPYVKPSFKILFGVNGLHFLRYLRDLHYYLPGSLAPYWLSTYFKCRMR